MSDCLQDVHSICYSDLVFDPPWPLFLLGLDIVKTNILTKFQAAEVKVWFLDCKQDFPSDQIGEVTKFMTRHDLYLNLAFL